MSKDTETPYLHRLRVDNDAQIWFEWTNNPETAAYAAHLRRRDGDWPDSLPDRVVLQSRYGRAINDAVAVKIDADPRASVPLPSGPLPVLPRPVWVEFRRPQPIAGPGSNTIRGALVWHDDAGGELVICRVGDVNFKLDVFNPPPDDARWEVFHNLGELDPVTRQIIARLHAPLPDPERPREHASLDRLQARLRSHLKENENAAPRSVREFPDLRRLAHRVGDGDDAVFVPSRYLRDLIEHHGEHRGSPELTAALIYTLAVWRVTKAVFRIDVTVLEELYGMEPPREIPLTHLQRLPLWAVYLPTPGWTPSAGHDVHGFFAALDRVSGRTVLRLTMEQTFYGAYVAAPVELHLGTARFEDALNETLDTLGYGEGEIDRGMLARAVGGAVNILLYLLHSAEEPVGVRPPQNPRVTRTKGKHSREVLTPVPSPMVWEVGIRMGRALRAATAPHGAGTGPAGGARKRPHLRAAHFHTFLTGPRSEPQPVLKWIPPIPVNADLDAAARAPIVVRDVPRR